MFSKRKQGSTVPPEQDVAEFIRAKRTNQPSDPDWEFARKKGLQKRKYRGKRVHSEQVPDDDASHGDGSRDGGGKNDDTRDGKMQKSERAKNQASLSDYIKRYKEEGLGPKTRKRDEMKLQKREEMLEREEEWKRAVKERKEKEERIARENEEREKEEDDRRRREAEKQKQEADAQQARERDMEDFQDHGTMKDVKGSREDDRSNDRKEGVDREAYLSQIQATSEGAQRRRNKRRQKGDKEGPEEGDSKNDGNDNQAATGRQDRNDNDQNQVDRMKELERIEEERRKVEQEKRRVAQIEKEMREREERVRKEREEIERKRRELEEKRAKEDDAERRRQQKEKEEAERRRQQEEMEEKKRREKQEQDRKKKEEDEHNNNNGNASRGEIWSRGADVDDNFGWGTAGGDRRSRGRVRDQDSRGRSESVPYYPSSSTDTRRRAQTGDGTKTSRNRIRGMNAMLREKELEVKREKEHLRRMKKDIHEKRVIQKKGNIKKDDKFDEFVTWLTNGKTEDLGQSKNYLIDSDSD